MNGASEPIWIDGKEVKEFPFELRLSGEHPHWLLDNKTTGYYIHAVNAPIRIVRRRQEWTYMFTRYLKDPNDNPLTKMGTRCRFRHKNIADNEKYYKPTVGDFALAWFEHGIKPKDAMCIYTLVVNTTPQEMAKFAEAMTDAKSAYYAIWQCDEKAHIVHDRLSGTTGYVLFTADGCTTKNGYLLGNNRPCFVMIREGDASLRVSVASTDASQRDPIVLRLRGHWQIADAQAPSEPKAFCDGEQTSLEFPFENYMPMHVTLRTDLDGVASHSKRSMGVKHHD
ncbi:MAG TPA: hypothetical protein EYP10_04840 [Armatimonadetes bacterium]|nr:hypothetical protein [Armatimonadota bacterium]